VYLEDFNDTTKYIKVKRYQKPNFFMEMLNKYVKIKFLKKDPSKVDRVPENLAFFLGAMFYHKELTNTLSENS
jgi:hypothetical protein